MSKPKTRKKLESVDFLNISLTVPFQLLSSFDEEARKRGYTRSESVRQAMRRLLEIWTGRAF